MRTQRARVRASGSDAVVQQQWALGQPKKYTNYSQGVLFAGVRVEVRVLHGRAAGPHAMRVLLHVHLGLENVGQ